MNDDERQTIINLAEGLTKQDSILARAILELADTVKRETMHGREALSAATIEALWSLIPPPPKPTPQAPVKVQKIDED